MDRNSGSDTLFRVKHKKGVPMRGKYKLYDPSSGSAYSKLSQTYEVKLRKALNEQVTDSARNIHHRIHEASQNLRLDKDAIQRETKDGVTEDSEYSGHHVQFDTDVNNVSNNTSYANKHAINSTFVRHVQAEAIQPCTSLPLDLETQNAAGTPGSDETHRSHIFNDKDDFSARIQVPYLEEPAEEEKSQTEKLVKQKKGNVKSPILIESFKDSTLRSFPKSAVTSQSFSMLTFNAGLLEVRMLGLQMYQNPGYTEKRLRCIPSEMRKANADVVAFQEVYSDHHANYIVRELRDLYPYFARNDCPPVSEAFEKLYKRKKQHRKRGLGMFHSGLLFLSKFPILCANFHPWDVVTHLEALLANKGYLEIFVDIPAIGRIVFYNMHMASASVNPESSHIEKVRNEEVRQLLRTAERACRLGFSPIIIGDLNAAPNNCTSNYMSFLHNGWLDSYVLSRQKVRHKKWQGVKANNEYTHFPQLLNSVSIGDYVSVENVFGRNSSQKPHLEKVTVMSNLARSKSGEGFRLSQPYVYENSRWSRFIDYMSHVRSDLRRHDTTWQSVRAYYPRGSSMSLRVIHCHALKKDVPKKNKRMARHRKLSLKTKLRVKLRAPSLDGNKPKTKSFRERCSALFRRSKSRGSLEGHTTSRLLPAISARSKAQIDTSDVCFIIRDPSMQLKKPQVKRFRWQSRVRNFMDVTWDPKNPLNIRGPHAGCSGLRCDYIFLPPTHISGILQGFSPSAGEILFREPIVLIDKVGSAYNCLCSSFTSMKKVMLVTLSDHYGLKITLSRKVVNREGMYLNNIRSLRTM